MPFCVGCGADVTSKSFCAQCGKSATGVTPAPASAIASPAVSIAPRKTSPIVWILLGVVGFFVLIGFAAMAGLGFLAHKVQQNPALAIAKLATAANPDIQVLSADEGANTVTFRDKRSGETVTMNFDEVKKGKIVFKGNGQQATIQAHGEGQNGTLEINSPQGTMKFGSGAAAKTPDWVPAYPGVSPQSTFSLQGGDGTGGSFQFTTKDSAKDVLSFYERSLKQSGFAITANITGNTDSASGGMISAEDAATKRTAVVTVGAEKGETSVNVLFGTKK
jgi:hypothetical protein